jgi:uncharacterized membrane protein HdeD (DUF308 family)
MLTPLMVFSAMGIASATTALWMESRPNFHQRIFAVLVSFSVAVSLFCMIAWAAAAIVVTVPLWLTWVFTGTLALLFALRSYRELRPPLATEHQLSTSLGKQDAIN